jgi:outer membrane protein
MIASKIWLVAALAAACVASVASAQNLKIGVINVARVIEQSPQWETAQKALEAEFGPRQRELAAARQRLTGQQETFQRDAQVMGEQERLTLERQIRDGQRDYQRNEQEYLEDLNLRRNEEIDKVNREVLQKAQEYARGEKYDLLLAGSNVIFASTAVDVTEAVLGVLKPAASGR